MAESPSAVILEPPKINSDTVSTVSPFLSHGVMGPDAMIFVHRTVFRMRTGASASRETSFSLKRLNIVFIFSDGGQIGGDKKSAQNFSGLR